MQTIGLIGGMSWESTVTYYQIINRAVRQQLGGIHSAKLIIASIDFAPLAEMQTAGDWDQAAQLLITQAQALQRAGADFILIGANTMHKVADQVQQAIDIPILHIATATIDALKAAQITRVGLLGTKYTLQQAFYKDRIKASSIDVLTPDDAGIDAINTIIYDELCAGVINDASRAYLKAEILKLQQAGAQGIILGCTELDLLVKPEISPLPLFDTTEIHALAAVKRALN